MAKIRLITQGRSARPGKTRMVDVRELDRYRLELKGFSYAEEREIRAQLARQFEVRPFRKRNPEPIYRIAKRAASFINVETVTQLSIYLKAGAFCLLEKAFELIIDKQKKKQDALEKVPRRQTIKLYDANDRLIESLSTKSSSIFKTKIRKALDRAGFPTD